MGDGDNTTPMFDEMFGKEQGKAGASAGFIPATDDDTPCPPLHRLHERRVVSAAGRMVVGDKMPPPRALVTQPGEGSGFSTRYEKRSGSAVSRTALVLACAVTLGSAAALTGMFDRKAGPPAGGAQGLTVADDVTAALPEPRTVQMLTISQAPASAIKMPEAAAETVGQAGPSQNFIRVAAKEGTVLTVENVFGAAGKPIRLPINLNGARPEDYSFLMFRGLPANVSLSAGFRLKESWAVSLRDVENLTLEAPNDFQGAFKIEILLVKGRDTPSESRVITVEIAPEDIQAPPSTAALAQPAPGPQVLTSAPRTIEPVEQPEPIIAAAPPAPKPAAQSPAALAAIPPQQEQAMMRRATAFLENKDVMSARLLFEHLASNGSAKGALAMGKTFDPEFFRSIASSGLKPDVAKAREWYRRAAELGDSEAGNRLNALASR